MLNNFKKIIDLVKKSKERVVLFDSNYDDGIVVMTLKEYSLIKDETEKKKEDDKVLTENNLIDSINKDIALLADIQNNKKNDDCVSTFYKDDDSEDYDNLYYYNDSESFTHFNIDEEENDDMDKERKVWNIPVDIQEGAE